MTSLFERTAGQAGPDYDNLTFRHGEHPLYPNEDNHPQGHQTIFAHHPEHGDVGRLHYRVLEHPEWTGWEPSTVHVTMMHVEPDHQRRGVASQLMNHLENHVHPDTLIDHGERRPDGQEWARAKYKDPSEMDGFEKSRTTKNGRPWNIQTKKPYRMPKKTARDWDEFRRVQDSQQRRYETAGNAGSKEDRDRYYGQGEMMGHGGREQLVTPKSWIQHTRSETLEDQPVEFQHHWRGFELGHQHAKSGKIDADEVQREHDKTGQSPHFLAGYHEGLESGFGEHAATLKRFAHFSPKLRVFTNTCGLDHRLWGADQKLKPEVRSYILHSITVMWAGKYENWADWARVFFAGSEASEWTSETLEGNNDFDVLVGVDYEKFRASNPQYRSWSNQEITDQMNHEFRQYNGPVMITVDGVAYGPWDRTSYVNPDSHDIRKIKPYAAYDVGKNEWVVKPPHLPHWSLSSLPGAVQKVLRATDTLARGVLKLDEPERTQQGAMLFDSWHSDRSRAFGPNGEGWWDIANLREKWLDQAGLWAQIVDCKHRFDEGLGAADADWSNMPKTAAERNFTGRVPEQLPLHPDLPHGMEPGGDHHGVTKGNPQLPLYRGLQAPVHEDDLKHLGKSHEHDQAIAHHVLNRIDVPNSDRGHRTRLGIHWSHDPEATMDVASNAHNSNWGGHGENGHAVMIEADHPGHEHVIDFSDPMKEDGGGRPDKPSKDWHLTNDTIGPHNMHNAMLPEVPIRPGAPMHIRALHVQKPDGDFHRIPVGFRTTAASMHERLDEVGRKEHPNVDHYQSGGMGHMPGDSSRSVVGFVPTQKLFGYEGNETHDKDVVHKVRDDIRSGKGITNPAMMVYDHKNRWAYLGEGNHRLEGATEAGARTVPVRFVRGDASHAKKNGIGGPMHTDTIFNDRDPNYVPSDIHPYHFLKDSDSIKMESSSQQFTLSEVKRKVSGYAPEEVGPFLPNGDPHRKARFSLEPLDLSRVKHLYGASGADLDSQSNINDGYYSEMHDSMKGKGRRKVPPVVATEHPDGEIELHDGWHRGAIALREGQTHLPAFVHRPETTKTAGANGEDYKGLTFSHKESAATASGLKSFDDLAPHEQHAASQYLKQMKDESLANDDETPHDSRYELRHEPVEQFKAKYMQGDFAEGYSPHEFDQHHRDLLASGEHIPNHPSTNRWPVIVNDNNHNYIDDGFHRFHSYVRDGATHIPTMRTHYQGHQQRTAGANGEDYKGLTFSYWKNYSEKSDHPEWLDGNDKHDSRSFIGMMAHHPDHPHSVGSLEFSPIKYGEDDKEVHIHGIKVPEEHQRRGVAKALMNEIERRYSDSPINHGLRTEQGKDWAKSQYGHDSVKSERPGSSTQYGDAPYDGGWTKGGKPFKHESKLATIQMMRPSELAGHHQRDDLDEPWNRHKIDDLKESINQYGYETDRGDPIRVGYHPDKGPTLTNGNKRIKALTELGYDVPVPVHKMATTHTAMPWFNQDENVTRPRAKSVKRVGFAGFVADRQWVRDHVDGPRASNQEADRPDHLDEHLSHFVRAHSEHASTTWDKHGERKDIDLHQPIYATQSHVSQYHMDRYRKNPKADSWALHNEGDSTETDHYQGHYNPLFVTHQGRLHAVEGHHRVGAALQDGRDSIPALHYDLDKHPIVQNRSGQDCPECHRHEAESHAEARTASAPTTTRLEAAHGSHDLSKLFGDSPTAPTPWPSAGRRKDVKDYEEDKVARSITHPHEFPVEQVDPRHLRSTQPSIIRGAVQHYMDHPSGRTYGEDNGGDKRLGNDIPRIYHRHSETGDQQLILSGHHRAAAALIKGEPLNAIVIHGGWGGPRK